MHGPCPDAIKFEYLTTFDRTAEKKKKKSYK